MRLRPSRIIENASGRLKPWATLPSPSNSAKLLRRSRNTSTVWPPLSALMCPKSCSKAHSPKPEKRRWQLAATVPIRISIYLLHRRNSRRLSVNRHFRLSECSAAAAQKVVGLIIRHTEIPELVIRLALRDYIEIHAFNIGRQI